LFQPPVAALILALVCLPLPFLSLENDADTSLILLLDYARQHGLQFGVDFVSTYGPLGFLIFPNYSSETAHLRLVADGLIAMAASTGLCLVAWRQPLPWRVLLLAVFLWTTANIRIGPDMLLNVMLFSWGFLCFVGAPRRLSWYGLITAALTGFCAVAKVSFLVIGAGSVVLVAAAVLLRGRRQLASGIILVFLAVFLAGWCGSGQDLGNLPAFLVNALAMIRGHNAALGIEAMPSVRLLGSVITVLASLLIILRVGTALLPEPARRPWGKLVMGLWAFALLFVAWKHGFVRADTYHVSLFLGFVPMLLLSLDSLPGGTRAGVYWLRSTALAGSLGALALLQMFCLQPLPRSILAPWESASTNVRRLLSPGEFRRQADMRLEEHRQQAQLPNLRQIVGEAKVDVLGFRQSYALYNGMNFRPRPVSQSYAACDAHLMRINERYLLSGKGADYFLFELNPLDSKFPALEDAMVVRDLVLNFKPVAAEGRFVLLRRTSLAEPRPGLLQETRLKPAESIDLRPFGKTNLWIEIELAPSLWGFLRQFVSQPPIVRLAAWTKPGGELIYRRQARASLLAAGFMASPLLRWTRDIGLDPDKPQPAPSPPPQAREAAELPGAAPRPGAYTLELNGQERFWESSASVRVYAIHQETSPATPGTAAATPQDASTRPFNVFRSQRWRPDMPPPGGFNETLAFALILLLPVAGVIALVFFARRIRRLGRPVSVANLVVGNVVVFATLGGFAWAVAETWFRFVHDTTDSLGYTRVSERWVERHWHLNAAGCRDNVEYAPGLVPGKRRVSFIGDSFTAGHGIKNVNDRFANLLRQAHPDWEIHVLANVGLDTGAETVLVNRLAAKGYDFDRVILVYCLNDLGDLVSQQDEALKRMFDSLAAGNWLTRNSYALNWFTLRYKAGRNPYVRNYFSFVREAYEGAIWERQKVRLREFQAAVEGHGGKLAVVTFPFLDALGPDYPYNGVHEQLSRFWQEQGVPHLDLLPVYARLSPSELVVNAHDAHPNERANRLAAEALEAFLFGK
jgi:hypothetical protein